MNDIKRELGRRIFRLREKRGLTRRQLAERAGLAPAHLGMIENGQRRDASVWTIAKIADAFRLTLDTLIRGDLDNE